MANMIWSCCYVAVCVFLIIYVTSWYTIDRRVRETSYILGYFNITDNSTEGAEHS
jgi:hypothetical protein